MGAPHHATVAASRTLILAAALLAVVPCAIAGERTDPAVRSVGPFRTFDYLYIEPNSGASSGGHAAVRFDEATYHFQHAEPGIIRSVKETAEGFEYAYRALGNRTMHVTSIAVSAETYARLRDAFERRHLVQRGQLDLLAARRRDRQLLEYLRDGETAPGRAAKTPGDPGIELRGSGYFVLDGPACGDAALPRCRASAPGHTTIDCPQSVGVPSAAVAILRQRIGDAYGSGYLAGRSDALRSAIDALSFAAPAPPPPAFAADRMPAARTGFADRYGELVLAWLAVEVLRTGGCARTETLRTSDDPSFRLSEAETRRLRRLAQRLAIDLVGLFDSRRPDVGFPLLVGMARLAALERSVASGRLVVLDGFPEHPQVLGAEMIRRYGDPLRAILSERRDELERARAEALTARASGEAAWSQLETAANLALELESAVEPGAPLRVYAGTPLPVKAAPLRPSWPRPGLSGTALVAAAAEARRTEREVEARLVALYPYHVVRRNCVTEIFRTIEAALGPGADGAAARVAAHGREDAGQRLGGHVRIEGTANFIPVVAHRAVRHTYRVAARGRLPSYRRQRLARLMARQSPLLVYLRESNSLTSTIQPATPGGDPFLFFTEDAVAPRPLLGVVNLGVGAGASVLGLVTLPFDHGDRLLRGMRGTLFSLPELAFINLRKGEIPILPHDWQAYGAEVDAAARGW